MLTALILAWWLHAQTTLEAERPDVGEYAESLRALDAVFKEIFVEISDQGICTDGADGHLSSPPISFYQMLMHKWVWSCKLLGTTFDLLTSIIFC